MSSATKAPKPPKAKKAKAAKQPKPIQAPGLFQVRLGDLIDLPELEWMPTLPQSAAPDTQAAADWDLMFRSLKKGLIERLKVVRLPDGKWGVADGRSRRHGLAQMHPPEFMVNVEEIDEKDVPRIVEETLHRRHLPAYSLTYVQCLRHADELLSRKRGRPSKLDEGAVTQAVLAERLDVSVAVVNACLQAIARFRAHPEIREEYERKILAGQMDPVRLPCAESGSAATKGSTRTAFCLKTAAPHLSALSANLRKFGSWPEIERTAFVKNLSRSAEKWPDEVLTAVAQVAAKKGGSQ